MKRFSVFGKFARFVFFLHFEKKKIDPFIYSLFLHFRYSIYNKNEKLFFPVDRLLLFYKIRYFSLRGNKKIYVFPPPPSPIFLTKWKTIVSPREDRITKKKKNCTLLYLFELTTIMSSVQVSGTYISVTLLCSVSRNLWRQEDPYLQIKMW